MNHAFWRGRRVLITGHSGFKGSWLTLWLDAMGAQVKGIALAPMSEPSLYGLTLASAPHMGQWVDIRDSAAVKQVLASFEPEVVFHLAAQAVVRDGYRDPLETFSTNVLGTAHVLEAARTLKALRAVLIVTSDKCYANEDGERPFTEYDPLGGNDPYSGSKACAEIVASTWRRAFFDGRIIATARAGNVIGGGDWAPDRLVPDLVRAANEGRSVHIRNPNAVRPWQHVLDALSGYLLLAEKLAEDNAGYAQAWNFGPNVDEDVSVADLVGAFSRLWETRLQYEMKQAPQPREAAALRLDSQRARSILGWRPRLAFGEALTWTVEWYRAWQHNATHTRAITLDQVRRYEERLVS